MEGSKTISEREFIINNASVILCVSKFIKNQFLKGLEHIPFIFNAIQNEQALSISYQSFKSTIEQQFEFSPYYLKQYNNRWFVFGRNNQYTTISNLALDRIVGIVDSSSAYMQNVQIDFEDFFEDIIGVSVPNNGELEVIRLQVESFLFPYIQSKPLHGSQKVKEENEDFSLIELQLIPNYELESVLLSFGEKIQVLEPLSLRVKLKQRLLNAAKNY